MAEFTLRQLQLFAALPDHATLSSAAATLRISESALSQAITALERITGEQLCVRRKARGLQLTPSGQYFARRARLLLRDAEALVSDLAGAGGQLRGPVHLGCFASFASSVLPPVLEQLSRRLPGVSVDVTVGSHDELLPALDSGLLDMAMVYDMELPAGYSQRTIYATELQAVLPPDHPLAAKSSVDLAELAEQPLIMYESSPSTANTFRIFDDRGLRPRIAASMPQVVLVQALVGRGLGYALLMSRPDAQTMTVEGRSLAVRPLSPPATQTTMCAIWPEAMELNPRAEAVLEQAVEVLGGLPEA